MEYQGAKLEEISFPLGGIGTGCIGLGGNGALLDWQIFNRPNMGGLNPYTFFAIRAQLPDGQVKLKVLQGQNRDDRRGVNGRGPKGASMAGFPCFEKVVFDGQFPVAKLRFSDQDFPAELQLTAFNPFIPLNSDDSSLPAAFFEWEICSKQPDVQYQLLLSVGNPFSGSVNEPITGNGFRGVYLRCADKTPDQIGYGDMTAAVVTDHAMMQPYWYRGPWNEGLQTFWRELTQGKLKQRRYHEPGKNDNCTVGAHVVLDKTQTSKVRFLLSWNVPVQYNYWVPVKDDGDRDVTWKNYYAVKFTDSVHSCSYGIENWDRLYEKTERFRKSLFDCSLDAAVIDAASASLAVLKSPVVLRLENGAFYGWESIDDHKGSCEGTCTHVWSYAYALFFLFPELERSIRETEFQYSITPEGGMYHRLSLPLGTPGWEIPCVDGQMASVFKTYREWKLSGDDEWLRQHWPKVRQLLQYTWDEKNPYGWDADKDGVLDCCLLLVDSSLTCPADIWALHRSFWHPSAVYGAWAPAGVITFRKKTSILWCCKMAS